MAFSGQWSEGSCSTILQIFNIIVHVAISAVNSIAMDVASQEYHSCYFLKTSG